MLTFERISATGRDRRWSWRTPLLGRTLRHAYDIKVLPVVS